MYVNICVRVCVVCCHASSALLGIVCAFMCHVMGVRVCVNVHVARVCVSVTGVIVCRICCVSVCVCACACVCVCDKPYAKQCVCVLESVVACRPEPVRTRIDKGRMGSRACMHE
jgi:hypothetical protein